MKKTHRFTNHNHRGLTCLLVALMGAGVTHARAHAQHAGDFWVGRDNSGKLKLGGRDVNELIFLLPVSGLIEGWSNNDPGFDRLVTSQPANNFLTLGSGAEISLKLVDLDPAFRVIDTSFFVLEQPGDETYLGDHQLHTHLIWHVNADDPVFDPLQCLWEATFVLLDDGFTGYRNSDPFTLQFTLTFSGPPTGDFNEDGVVDLEDFALMENCLTGPTPGGIGCQSVCLGVFDFDTDGDVDLRDYASFLDRFR